VTDPPSRRGLPPTAGDRWRRGAFDRPTVRVARELLGAWLVVRQGQRRLSARIVETEAYVARDAASHTFRGPTRHNRSMFGPPGTLYVYRIHQVVCANVVTQPGQAVLLRAAEPGPGLRGDTRGPGRLCRTLGITLLDDGSDVVHGRVEVRSGARRTERIVVGPRVGISRGARRRLRYALDGNRWVSLPRPRRVRPTA